MVTATRAHPLLALFPASDGYQRQPVGASTSVALSGKQARFLGQAARATGLSQGELIRRLIARAMREAGVQ